MSRKVHRVHIRKEALKFSAAHMTVFPDGRKESLHGHNYTTEVTIDLVNPSFETLVPFSAFKSAIDEICQAWDEKVLIAEKCPFLDILSQKNGSFEFKLCQKRYVLPIDEVVLLPLENITSESLAEEFYKLISLKLDSFIDQNKITRIQVRIEESPGQGAAFIWEN